MLSERAEALCKAKDFSMGNEMLRFADPSTLLYVPWPFLTCRDMSGAIASRLRAQGDTAFLMGLGKIHHSAATPHRLQEITREEK